MIPAVYSDKKLFALPGAFFVIILSVALYTENYFISLAPFGLLLFFFGWKYKELLFWLLLLSIPFSFEYNFSSSLGTDIPDEGLMLLVALVFLGYWLYKPAAVSKEMLQHPLIIILLTTVVWLLFTVLFSTDKTASVKFLLAKSWYLGAFVLAPILLFRQKSVIKTAGLVLTVSVMLVAIISLIRHSSTGFSFATINDAVSPFFRNHVNYSAMLVCMIPVLAACFFLCRRKISKLIIASLILIALAALFFSFARSAWLALLAGAITYWLLRKKLLFYFFILCVLLAGSSLWWLKNNDRYLAYAHDYKTTIFHKDFNEHFVATYKLKDVSTAERFYRWIAGVRMIKDNPVTGYGPATFYQHYKPYAVPAFKTWVSDNKDQSTVHNYFLLIAIEQGIPGLLFFLLLAGAMFWYAQHLYTRIKDSFYKTVAAVLGVITTMIIVVNFLSDLIETDKTGSLFFLCIALLVITDVNTRKELNTAPHIQSIP